MATKKAPELFYDESRFCGGCGHGIFNRILAYNPDVVRVLLNGTLAQI